MTKQAFSTDLIPYSPAYVYLWTCTVNGKMYLGSHLPGSEKYIGGGKLFRLAWKKHPRHTWSRVILYRGIYAREVEAVLLNAVDAANNPKYYNLKNSSEGGLLGLKHTEETLAKMRENSPRGTQMTAHSRYLLSLAMTGRKLSPQHRQKISDGGRGIPKSESWRAKAKERTSGEGNPFYGKSHTDEFKRIASMTATKNNHTRWHVNRGIVKPGCPLCETR